jgi:hypothetical protein
MKTPHKHSQLRPTLGPVQLTFYGIGVIVGAGVYSVIGAASAIAHDALWFSFVIGGFVAFLTGLSYAEMTTAFPAAGAEYSYVRRAFPKAEWISVLVALTILIGASATASTVAVAFGGYLCEFVDLPQPVSALLLLVGCTVLNVIGLRESSWANILFTCIEVGGLLLVITAGLTKGNVAADVSAPLHPDVIEAAAILFFVYLGFEQIANLSEEVRTPARDIPRAIFLSIGVTTVLYVLVALAVLAVARPAELAGSSAPLAVVMQHAWPQAGPLMSGIALFATANTVLITMIASSRLLFSMARDGFILCSIDEGSADARGSQLPVSRRSHRPGAVGQPNNPCRGLVVRSAPRVFGRERHAGRSPVQGAGPSSPVPGAVATRPRAAAAARRNRMNRTAAHPFRNGHLLRRCGGAHHGRLLLRTADALETVRRRSPSAAREAPLRSSA